MLKGESLIELTDVRTGEKEVYRDTNMVTNALSDVINCSSAWMADRVYNMAQYMYPIYENLLGGVVLFPEQLEENPAKYWAPYNLDPVGFASNVANTGSDTRRGSINVNESGPVLNDAGEKTGYKYVWDFNTAQGNGQIASICLTHPQAGYNWYGCEDISSDGRLKDILASRQISKKESEDSLYDTSLYTILINRSTGYAYSNNFEKGKLYREKVTPLNGVGGNDKSKFIKLYMADEIFDEVLDYQETAFYKHNKTRFNVAVSDTEILAVSNAGNASGNAEVYWIKIDTSTGAYTEGVWTIAAQLIISKEAVAYSNGYLFWVSYDRKSVYKINLSNVADVTQIMADFVINNLDVNNAKPKSIIISLPSGVILGQGFYITDDKIHATDSSDVKGNLYNKFGGAVIGPYLYHFARYSSYGYYANANLSLIPQYLATINNLSSPVTKTADKTMKITYTLTEVQEES
ncbi:MAG: hypothetical protein ACI4HQ_03700 [Acetatifactor sp.]